MFKEQFEEWTWLLSEFPFPAGCWWRELEVCEHRSLAGPDFFFFFRTYVTSPLPAGSRPSSYFLLFNFLCLCIYQQMVGMHTQKNSIISDLLMSVSLRDIQNTHTHFRCQIREVVQRQVPVFQPQAQRPLWSSLVGNDCRNCTVIFLYSSKCSLIGKKIYKYIWIYKLCWLQMVVI